MTQRKLQFDSLIYEHPKKRNMQNVNKTTQCLPSTCFQNMFNVNCIFCMASMADRKRTLVNWCRSVIETNPSEFRYRLFGYFPISISLDLVGAMETYIMFTFHRSLWVEHFHVDSISSNHNSKKTSMHENSLVHLWIMQI